jgi:hypothetical protein
MAKLRLKAQNAQVSLKEFRSKVWVKDDCSREREERDADTAC